MKEITQGLSIDKETIIAEVKKKYPGVRLFLVAHPYGGIYIIRPQLLADVREAAEKLRTFVENKINEAGGAQAINALSEEAQGELQQKINADYADYSNELVLSQCVVYPYDFSEQLKKGTVPGGIVPFLLEKIMDVSCWGDAEVEDI